MAEPIRRETQHRIDLERLALSAWLICVAVGWGVLGSSDLRPDLSEPPLLTGLLVALALLAPTLLMLRREGNLYWLLGLSAAIGVVPRIPLFPFVSEYAHIVLILVAATAFTQVMLERRLSQRADIVVKLLLYYIFVAMMSVAVNFLMRGDVWQLKVGISHLVIVTTVASIYIFSSSQNNTNSVEEILNGLIVGAAFQIGLAVMAAPLLFTVPYSEDGNSIFGLAYFDRYSGTFHGPVALALFFVAVTPVLLMKEVRVPSWISMVYLQVVPWAVMVTGSRSARIMQLVVLSLLLIPSRTRMKVVLSLPSAVLAYSVAFYYNSFPAAVKALLGDDEASSLSLQDRFFETPDRWQMAADTSQAISTASWPQLLLGYGPGVGGHSSSGYESSHTGLLNAIYDTGLMGAAGVFFVLAVIGYRLLRQSVMGGEVAQRAQLLLISYIVVLAANVTYVPQHWGFCVVIIFAAHLSTTTYGPHAVPISKRPVYSEQ